MIIRNTTFIVPEKSVGQFLVWAKGTYLPALCENSVFSCPRMARVLAAVEPGTVAVAIQAQTGTMKEATEWHDHTASGLADDLSAQFSGQVVFFTTYMETID